MAETDKKWYVLRAVSGKEAKVKEYIEAQIKHEPLLAANVSQVLIPTEKHASVRNGKRIVKEKVSMAGYVFVEASLVGDVAHMLRFVPNVLAEWITQHLFLWLTSIVCLALLKSQNLWTIFLFHLLLMRL